MRWDFYNLMFSYSSRDGGSSWDEELRDDERSSEEMVAALREGPLAEYADLFHRYVEMERGDVDDGLIDGLPYAVRVPQSLR